MREAGSLQGQVLALLNIARLQELQGNILAACEAWQEVQCNNVWYSVKTFCVYSYKIFYSLCLYRHMNLYPLLDVI